jgi:hypothetical protein
MKLKNYLIQEADLSHNYNYQNNNPNNYNYNLSYINDNTLNFHSIHPSRSFNSQYSRSAFTDNINFNPKIIENDDHVKKNITEQIKNVIYILI